MKGYFSEEALELYANLAAEVAGTDFAEGEVYDFTRCMRPDGTFYGTSGKCRQGSETGAREKEAPKRTGRLNKEKQWSPPVGGKRPPENPTAEQITKMSKDELWNGKAAYKPGTAGHQAYKNEIDRRRDLDERLKARGVEPQKEESGKGKVSKPRKSAGELRAAQQALFDDAKAKRAAAKEAEKTAKTVAKETKDDKSPEARKRRLEAGRAWDKANTAADRAQQSWMKAHEQWSKSVERENRAKMSPEQRKETRRIDKIIKERG
jgi:hypothetical protein